MPKHIEELGVAVKAAKKAGKILMRKYGHVSVKYKKDKSFVTEADILSEKKIKRTLKKEFPDYSFLGEESGLEDNKSEYTWIIDPLDGTTNYAIHNPFFNVSISLAKKDEPVVGVVYSPFQNEMFYAVKGRGAFLNDKKIFVSKKKELKTSFVGFCHAHDEKNTQRISAIFPGLKNASDHVRQIGAAELELAYVAAGRIEAFIMLKQNPWDVASGSLLVKEAGGTVTDIKGKSFNLKSYDLVASNKLVHSEIMKIIGGKNVVQKPGGSR